ncbi:MAG: TIGR03936 family radical SAM-associated protein [Eubacterium sp.]|nr:TIGR03936 family radical SAM-associated protein [Eubacterium sp.]
MKARIKFSKTGNVKFIGHLDVMRYFQKLIRRAKLDVTYSQGFHPHQIMSFTSPLSVGIESVGEYFDIETNSKINPEEAVRVLNEHTVDEIQVLKYVELPDDAKKSMALLAGADYSVELDISNDVIVDFLNQESIEILKKTKKSEKVVDIKPLIYKLENRDGKLFMQLAHGSKDNLKPGLVVEALCKFAEIEKPEFVKMCRLEMYYEKDGKLTPLDEV